MIPAHPVSLAFACTSPLTITGPCPAHIRRGTPSAPATQPLAGNDEPELPEACWMRADLAAHAQVRGVDVCLTRAVGERLRAGSAARVRG